MTSARELIGARNEVGLAVHFHEDADLAAHVDVAADRALAGRAAGLLRRRREAALAQQGGGRFEVAVRFGQRGFAFHEAGAGHVAKFLHELCRNCHVISGPVSRHYGTVQKKRRSAFRPALG